MSTAPKVSALAAAGSATSSSWVAPTGRYGSDQPLDPAAAAAFFGISDSQQQLAGDGSAWWGGSGASRRRSTPLFTPLVGRLAAAFPANEAFSDSRTVPALFLTDLRHAVAVYETNMRITGSASDYQGSLVNRYY